MKIFYHEQISHKIFNGEFFPNYGRCKNIHKVVLNIVDIQD